MYCVHARRFIFLLSIAPFILGIIFGAKHQDRYFKIMNMIPGGENLHQVNLMDVVVKLLLFQ